MALRGEEERDRDGFVEKMRVGAVGRKRER